LNLPSRGELGGIGCGAFMAAARPVPLHKCPYKVLVFFCNNFPLLQKGDHRSSSTESGRKLRKGMYDKHLPRRKAVFLREVELWMRNCTLLNSRRSYPPLRSHFQRSANMKRTPRNDEAPARLDVVEAQKSADAKISSPARRSFLGKIGAGAAVTAAAGVFGSAPAALASINPLKSIGANLTGSQSNRVAAATALRIAPANADAALGAAPHTTNGDEA